MDENEFTLKYYFFIVSVKSPCLLYVGTLWKAIRLVKVTSKHFCAQTPQG